MARQKQSDPFLIELLIRRYSWFIQEMNAALEASDQVKLTRAQIIFLFYLDDGKDRAQTMSEKLGLSRQAVSLTVRELEKEGIIKLMVDPQKRNAKLIKMTPRGRRSVEHAFEVLRRLERKIARKIGAANLASVKKLLQADWG